MNMSDDHSSAPHEPDAASAAHSPEAHGATRGDDPAPSVDPDSLDLPREYGGRKGLEPVRYGDWEKNGRCIDF